MKKLNIAFVTLLISFALFTMQSCKKDDTTFTTKYTAAQPVATSPVVRADGTVFFTGTTVDLKWSADNKGSGSVTWDLYFGASKSPALLQSGLTAPSKTVTVEDGITYYWKVVTTDAEGIKTTSETFKFTAVNGSNPKLVVGLTCATDILTSIGVDLIADDVIDLRMVILKKSDMSVVATVNAAKANEIYRNFQTLADGDYVIAVNIASTLYAGDLNSPITLDLTLKFTQLGMIDTTLEFPSVMTNEFICSLYQTNLATVKKVGSAYTIERALSYLVDNSDDASLVGTWGGWDADPSFPSQVVSAITGGKLLFDGIGSQWMLDLWGETILTHTPIEFTFNYCEGTFTIPNQQIMTTLWNGDEQPPYFIEGSGTYDLSGTFPVITIKYDFIQPDGGGAIAKYFDMPYFEAGLTLDPAGKGVISKSGVKGKGLVIKPSRK